MSTFSKWSLALLTTCCLGLSSWCLAAVVELKTQVAAADANYRNIEKRLDRIENKLDNALKSKIANP